MQTTQLTRWSCPKHSRPWHPEDACDCGCVRDDVGCLGCRYGRWLPVVDETGEPVMVPAYSIVDMSDYVVDISPTKPTALSKALQHALHRDMKILWNEDSLEADDGP